MNSLFGLPIVLLSLVFSLTASASVCDDDLAQSPARSSQTYSPSFRHLIGEDLAAQAIKATIAYHYPGPNSVWLDYQRDPRFRGRLVPPDRALAAFVDDLSGKNFPVVVADIRAMKKKWSEQLTQPLFLFTWKDVGVRAINRLTELRIHVVGLSDRPKNIRGRQLNPEEASIHDLELAIEKEELLNSSRETSRGKDTFSKIFYGEVFRYSFIMARLSKNDQVLFDIAYYLYFQELLGRPLWGNRLARLSTSKGTTAYALQNVYQHESGLGVTFDFDFSQDASVKTTLKERSAMSYLITRLLSKDDLKDILPVEVNAQMAASPTEAANIVAAFLDKAFDLFFKIHYSYALHSLGLNQGHSP